MINDVQVSNGEIEKSDFQNIQIENDTNNSDFKSKAPDGGWGWVIVIAALIVSSLYDGVTYSFGVLTTEFVEHYDVSRTVVGFMGSVLVGMTLCTGPIVSSLCNKYGYRFVIILGGLISSISFAAPYFYSPLWFLILTSTILTG